MVYESSSSSLWFPWCARLSLRGVSSCVVVSSSPVCVASWSSRAASSYPDSETLAEDSKNCFQNFELSQTSLLCLPYCSTMGRMLLVTIRWALLKLLSISCRVSVICCSSRSSSSVRVRLREEVWRDMAGVGLTSKISFFTLSRTVLEDAPVADCERGHGRLPQNSKPRSITQGKLPSTFQASLLSVPPTPHYISSPVTAGWYGALVSLGLTGQQSARRPTICVRGILKGVR
jgi:hypothetical protein